MIIGFLLVIACIYATASGFYVDQVAGFSEGFPLEGEDGLMEGDIFYKIDGWRTYLRGDASLLLQFNDGKGVDMEVIRDGEKVVLKDLPLYRGTYDGQEGRFGLMVGAARVPANLLQHSEIYRLPDPGLCPAGVVQPDSAVPGQRGPLGGQRPGGHRLHHDGGGKRLQDGYGRR